VISLTRLQWPLWCSGSSSGLSLPPRYSIGGLVGGDSVVVPLDGVRGNLPGPVLNLVAGGG
jgi:hypothetical protein